MIRPLAVLLVAAVAVVIAVSSVYQVLRYEWEAR